MRLTIKRGMGNTFVYGNMKDGNDGLAEVERVCAWLMDPMACPTKWPTLLTIRTQNPNYGQGAPPTAN